MDEVGFMVTQITEKAFKISNRWRLVGQVMLAQQVQIKTTTGKVYHGVIGSKPPHVNSGSS